MAKPRNRKFRVGKIEVIKAVARRPRGLLRPGQVHRDDSVYSRRRAKGELRRQMKEES